MLETKLGSAEAGRTGQPEACGWLKNLAGLPGAYLLLAKLEQLAYLLVAKLVQGATVVGRACAEA